MGPVETAVRREVQGNSALAELAYLLAREIDLGSGGVAAVRELRAVLTAFQQRRPVSSSFMGQRAPLRVVEDNEGNEDWRPTRCDVCGRLHLPHCVAKQG